MRKVFLGALLGIFATASYAQSVITFNVDFHTVYAASGGFAPNLTATAPGPFNNNEPIPEVNLTGQVTMSTITSTSQLAPQPAINTLTLNGDWTSESGFEPANTWSTHSYDNAVFEFSSADSPFGYVAVDFVSSGNDWPLLASTASDGLMSDHGPAGLYGGTCPFFFGCLSPNPMEATQFAGGTQIFDPTANGGLGAPNFPTYANAGNHALISGSYTGGNVQGGLGSENGLDAIAFDMVLVGGQVPQDGGTVRFLVFSDSAETAYMVEGTIVPVPVPAAVWLFGSAIGLLGWMRRRASV